MRIFSDEDIKEIKRLTLLGWTGPRLAAKYGCHLSAIAELRSGATYGGKGKVQAIHKGLPRELIAQIVDAYNSGLTCAEVAAKFGVSSATVSNHAKFARTFGDMRYPEHEGLSWAREILEPEE